MVLLLAVPLLALAVAVGYSQLFEWVLASFPIGIADLFSFVASNYPGNLTLLFWIWIALLVLATIASAAAVSRAVSRIPISERLFRFAFIPAVLTAITMAVLLICAIIGSLNGPAPTPEPTGLILPTDTYTLSHTQNSRIFLDNPGLTPFTTAWWLGTVLLMSISTSIAIFSVLRHSWGRAAPALEPAVAS